MEARASSPACKNDAGKARFNCGRDLSRPLFCRCRRGRQRSHVTRSLIYGFDFDERVSHSSGSITMKKMPKRRMSSINESIVAWRCTMPKSIA